MKKMYIYMMVAVVAIGLAFAIFGGNGKVDSSMNNSTSFSSNSETSTDSTTNSYDMDHCTPGADYGVQLGSRTSKIIGYEEYKGKTFCKAESSQVDRITAAGGGMVDTHKVYYFDQGSKDMYVLSTVVTTMDSNPTAPKTVNREYHLIDGVVVS